MHLDPEEGEVLQGLQSGESGFLQGDVVVVVEVIDAHNFVTATQQPNCTVKSYKSCHTCNKDFHGFLY